MIMIMIMIMIIIVFYLFILILIIIIVIIITIITINSPQSKPRDSWGVVLESRGAPFFKGPADKGAVLHLGDLKRNPNLGFRVSGLG